MALPNTVKRKHVHWTFVRTNDPNHKQPNQTPKQATPLTDSSLGFWKACYKKAKRLEVQVLCDQHSIMMISEMTEGAC